MVESALKHILEQLQKMEPEKPKSEAEELKLKGNEAFAKKDYVEAKQFYTKAIGISSHNSCNRIKFRGVLVLWKSFCM